MTEKEKEYWEKNHDEAAALQYAVDNGMMNAEDIAAPKKPESTPSKGK